MHAMNSPGRMPQVIPSLLLPSPSPSCCPGGGAPTFVLLCCLCGRYEGNGESMPSHATSARISTARQVSASRLVRSVLIAPV